MCVCVCGICGCIIRSIYDRKTNASVRFAYRSDVSNGAIASTTTICLLDPSREGRSWCLLAVATLYVPLFLFDIKRILCASCLLSEL